MARSKTITFSAKLTNGLHLEVTGIYTPPYGGSYDSPPESAEFHYNKVEFITGDVAELLDYIDWHLPPKTTMSEWMEELCEKNYFSE